MQKFTYEDVAGMIDHALLHPTLTEKELFKGCQLADCYETATVCVKPSDVKQAAQLLNGSKTKICTVIGFPHGVNLTEIKVFETQRACEDGASEVDMVLNTGKAISGDWKYIEDDILAVCEKTHSSNAKLKVIFENDFLAKGGAGLDGNDLKKNSAKFVKMRVLTGSKPRPDLAMLAKRTDHSPPSEQLRKMLR